MTRVAAMGLLLVSCGVWLVLGLRQPPPHATLPIFVPASLAYEQAMRAERGQPPGLGGQEAALLAEHLLSAGVAPGDDPRLAERVAAMKATRAALLEARNARHALNIANMQLGVALARELDPAQWDHVQSNRDAFRARAEFESYDRLLESLK